MGASHIENIDNEALHGLITENICDVVWIVPFGNSSKWYVSPSVTDLTGYSRDEFTGMKPEKIFSGESWDLFLQILEYYKELSGVSGNAEAPSCHTRNFDLQMIGKQNNTLWVEARVSLFRDHQKRDIGVQMVLRDVSGRKQQEENTARLLSKQKELNRFKSKVISIISHEFRTPISIIYSNLQILKKFTYQIDEGIQMDAFELTTAAIHSLSKTLDDLTLLNQSNKGVLTFNPSGAILLKECEKIAGEINSIDAYGGRIFTNFDFPDIEVKLDKELLKHIVNNLLINALKFSRKDTKVAFELKEKPGNIAWLCVRDQGIGIPEEELEHIFDSFYRGSNTSGIKGTGLGLSIVKRCVDLHKGGIDIQSKVDSGTEVIVTLPYERAE
ncbi:MAG: PAS domain-containing sensor histidine kinase [Bacteroidales bacterium]